MAEELAYAIDGLDSAYSDLMEVADGKLTGLGEVGELAGDATEEEREFAKWHADLGESTKRFINATSEHIKREGSTGIDNFIAGGEAVQMCDYLVKHWDKNRDGALDVIQEREEELIMNGRMHGLESVSTALGYRVIPPIARTPNELLSGIMYSDLEDGMRFDHKAGLSGMWDDSPLPDLSDEEWTDVGVLFGLVGIDDDGEYFEVEGVLDDVEHYVGELGLAGLGELEGWFSRLKKKIRRAARKVRRSARKIGRRVKRSFRKAGRWTRRTVRRAGRAVKRGFRKIGRGIKKAARWAAKKSSGVFKKLRKIFKKSVTFVRNGITYVWDKTKGLMKKVGKALVKAGKAIAHAMVWLGKKIKEIAVKFARLLNPKNIIARTTLLRRTRKGRHGLANNMYYGMVGWTKAKQMGASRKDYEDSKAAYDKCLRNLRKWGSGRRALNKAIRKGYDPKRVYNPESKEQLKRSVKGEVGHMDKKAIVAKEQNAVYKKHGVSESERKALSGGLGLATMVIIAIISLRSTVAPVRCSKPL